jgi:hypothetical protein
MSMMRDESVKLLPAMVKRLSHNPAYMAHTLHLYKCLENCGDEEVGNDLEISSEKLLRLALCKHLDTKAPDLAAQVQQISEYTEIAGSVILNLVEQVEALTTLPKVQPTLGRNLSYLYSAIEYLVPVISYQASSILLGICLLALLSVVVAGWQSEENQVQKVGGLPAQTNQTAALTETTRESSTAGKLLPESQFEFTSCGSQAATRNPSTILTQRSKRREAKGGMAYIGRIKLPEYKQLRDKQEVDEPEFCIVLPQSRMRIRFELPQSNRKGAYKVCIVDAFNRPLVSSASRTEGKILRVELDTRDLEAKSYRLCISREGEAPNSYYAAIGKAKN